MDGNVYFPFSPILHIIGAALCAGYMMYSFIRVPKAYKALMAGDILLTFGVYLCRGIMQRSLLSVAEIVIFIAVILLKHIKVKPKYKAEHYK